MFDPYATLQLSIPQVQEALGEINMWYTWESLGRPDRQPTIREALVYYINHATPFRIKNFFVFPTATRFPNVLSDREPVQHVKVR